MRGSKEEPLLGDSFAAFTKTSVVAPLRKRWYLLSLLFYNTLCAGLLYLGFSVIEDRAREHFGVSRFVSFARVLSCTFARTSRGLRPLALSRFVLFALTHYSHPFIKIYARHHAVCRLAINSMAVLGTSMPICTYPVAAKVVDTRGIRWCHIIGTCVVCLGAWTRFLGSREYWVCFAGQAILSVGMSFLNSLPAALSARWFPQKERSLATSIAMLSFLTGMAVGQGIASFFEDNIPLYLLGQAGLLTVPIPFVYAFVENAPPPLSCQSSILSSAAGNARDNDDADGMRAKNASVSATTGCPPIVSTQPRLSVFSAMLRVLKTSPSVRWLCVAAMFGIGTFNTMLALVDEIVPPSIKGHESVLSGACFFAPGLIGTILMAKYLDASRAYLTVGRSTCAIVLVAFGILCYGWHRNIAEIIYPAYAVIGFVGLGLIPLCVELGIELSFDPAIRLEGAVNAVIQTSINLGSMISLYAFDPGNLGIADKNAIFLWYAIVALSLCCILRVEPDYRRLAFERRAERGPTAVSTHSERGAGGKVPRLYDGGGAGV